MKMIRASFVIFVIQILFGCAATSRSHQFFFLQMADTQFGFFADNEDFQKETINFEKAIAEANRLQPAFIIVCGDLVNKTGDPDQIAEYKRIASQLDPAIGLYNVAGNHDVGNVPTKSSLLAYRKNIGPDHYIFQSGNIFGIVLNSSLMKEPDSARDEAVAQDQWLQGALEQGRKSRQLIIIFQHHPYFISAANEPDQYFNFPVDKRRSYLDLFKKYKVKYIFAGHYHRNGLGRDGSLEMVTTGPIGRPLGPDPSGLRLVVIDGNLVKHTYYSLDALHDVVN